MGQAKLQCGDWHVRLPHDRVMYFYPERPSLAVVGMLDRLEAQGGWVAEPKYNGMRLMLHHLPNGDWQFWNRHGAMMSYRPPLEMTRDLDGLRLKGYWLFDCELRHGKVRGVRDRIKVFDIIIAAGHLLLDKPFSERRGILEVLFHYNGPCDGMWLDLMEQYEEDFRTEFERIGKYEHIPAHEEIEGLVVKNLNGMLSLGRTSAVDSTWMWKVRHPTKNYRF